MFRLLLFAILFLFLLQACKEHKSLDKKIIIKEYGYQLLKNDSTSVELNIDKYPTYGELHERMQDLVCNDSTPKITFNSKGIFKTVYINDYCFYKVACILLKEKNNIRIIKDSIFKVDEYFPIDSLFFVMKKDYNNNGKDPMYSDSPDRIGVEIGYEDNDKTENLINLLDKITKSFDSVKTEIPLNIYLMHKLMIAPPPPPIHSN